MKQQRRLNLGQSALVRTYKLAGTALDALSAAERELARQSAATWADEIRREVADLLERLRTLRDRTLLVADVYPSEVL